MRLSPNTCRSRWTTTYLVNYIRISVGIIAEKGPFQIVTVYLTPSLRELPQVPNDGDTVE